MKKNYSNSSAVNTLSKKRDKLISRFLNEDELLFHELYSDLLDDYFRESFEKSFVGPDLNITKNPYAIIALGGYGRREQCIFSDVDVLFLFEKKVPEKAEDLIKEMAYPLWDIGLEVGHSTRNIKECVNLSKTDISVLTSLLDARFICGISNVYWALVEQIRCRAINRRSGRIIKQLLKLNEKRHENFGDSSYLLEPNLKDGHGGLRDYHTMLWAVRILYNIKDPRDLEYEGFLSHDEYHKIKSALSFILNVRSRLHHIVGRKTDRLYFEYQIKLAKTLKFTAGNGQKAVENFLGRLHGEMEFIKQLYMVFLNELGYAPSNLKKKRQIKEIKIKGIEIKRGLMGFSSPEKILHYPNLLIEIFRESDKRHIPLSAEAKRLVKEFSPLISEKAFASGDMAKLFEKILIYGDPEFNALDEMLNTGLLARIIPEFNSIMNRIQFDEYHLYPVDKHSLNTLLTIQRWRRKHEGPNEPMCISLYEDLKTPMLLHWAALLHDIGKGSANEDHAKNGELIAHAISTRLGFSEDATETIKFLVNEHLFLIKTATRRDINDEETCINCAKRIKDAERLKMLYLLTVADSIATGPKAWNEWTASLLRDLFLKVLKIIEKGEFATEKAVETVEEKKRLIKNELESKKDEESLSLLPFMSPRYLLSAEAEDISKHIDLYKKMGKERFIWEVKRGADSDTRTVTVCAKDAPGLISKIAGAFTLNKIDILNVQVFTWLNGIALDIFEVKPPPDVLFEDDRWRKAENDLRMVLENKINLLPEIKEKMAAYKTALSQIGERPCRVKVDNESSSFFTIIDVFAYDYLGLLFNITDALFRLGLDVWVAKIATKVDQVVDVFYVRDFEGQKVDSKEQEINIKNAIEAVIRTA